MQFKELHNAGGLRTFALILQAGDEAMSCLKRFATENGVGAAQMTAIGAFERAVLKYFDWNAKAYRDIPVAEQVEVAALIGDISLDPEKKPAIHVHLVLGRRDGSALAGHLGEGVVRPTLEVIIHETPRHLQKTFDTRSGLALIDIGADDAA